MHLPPRQTATWVFAAVSRRRRLPDARGTSEVPSPRTDLDGNAPTARPLVPHERGHAFTNLKARPRWPRRQHWSACKALRTAGSRPLAPASPTWTNLQVAVKSSMPGCVGAWMEGHDCAPSAEGGSMMRRGATSAAHGPGELCGYAGHRHPSLPPLPHGQGRRLGGEERGKGPLLPRPW